MEKGMKAEKQKGCSSASVPMVEVFCRYIRRNGKIIYPKQAKYFHFWMKAKVV